MIKMYVMHTGPDCEYVEKQVEGKTIYEVPEMTVLEVNNEGVVCQSSVNGSNSIDGWGNGGSTNDEIFF